MRSDARKRLEAAARRRQPAPVRVFQDELADWTTTCDRTCPYPMNLYSSTWHDAYEAALGHACLHHASAS